MFSKLKIGQRLAVGFAAVLVLTVVVGAGAINRLAKVNDATADIATNWLPATRALGMFASATDGERRHELLAVYASEQADRDAETKALMAARADADKAWADYEATITGPEEQKIADEVVEAKKAFRVIADRSIGAASKGDNATALASLVEGRVAFKATAAATRKDIELQSDGSKKAYQESQRQYEQARLLAICLVAAAVAIGAGLAFVITRSITGPIRAAVTVAETVAAGDLTSRVRSDSSDETGQLLAALTRMNDNLARIVSDVRQASDSIATGSTQIATGNQDLSQRTEEQASNLQQTAASMEQLTSTVKNNADAAQQARQLAATATQAAEEGGAVVGQVVSTMNDITASSKKIADIIAVIDGIAFQTNILALNAAVEAARAGEQGRGFAVVAGEVRALAQRSAEAAKEIKVLIGESVERVEVGSALVGDAGTAIANIVTQVKRVNDLVGEISSASIEQSQGISQIGDAVAQLDQVTQQNAALVEESASAAESLKHQAEQMARTVAVFRLASGAAPSFTGALTTSTPKQRASMHPAAKVAVKPGAAAQPSEGAIKATAGAEAGGDWTSF